MNLKIEERTEIKLLNLSRKTRSFSPLYKGKHREQIFCGNFFSRKSLKFIGDMATGTPANLKCEISNPRFPACALWLIVF